MLVKTAFVHCSFIHVNGIKWEKHAICNDCATHLIFSKRPTQKGNWFLWVFAFFIALQVFPPVTEIYTAGMLNLTCEYEEPVIMKEVLPPSAQDIYSYLDDDDYGRDRSDDIVETTERTDQKSHVANYMEIAPAPGRSGEIQCLSEKDGKVLHTWKYRIIRRW